MLTAALIALTLTLPPVDDAVTREHLVPLLANEADHRLVVETFRRHPEHVLPFIDSYLEGGLAQIEESGVEMSNARSSFRTGLQFAGFATEAFGDAIFTEYAASFASWSPQEQNRFRAGQQAYRAARGIDDPGAALPKYREALELSSSLRDRWGEAMALGGIAKAMLASGDMDSARDHAQRAANLYRRLRLEGSEASALMLLARALEQHASPRTAVNVYGRAWQILQKRPADDAMRREVVTEYLAALDRAGDTERAAMVREQAAAGP